MITHNLGYPRIGAKRELKRACEQYWSGKIDISVLLEEGKRLRREHWLLQKEKGIDLIPTNDFSFYDQVLDMSYTLGAVPKRFSNVFLEESQPLDLYFAMARGYQKNGFDITAMEMTKWFDTNYHYIVPEFYKDQQFKLNAIKVVDELKEAKSLNLEAKPVLIGPITYLLLGKEKEEGFNRLDLINRLLPIYVELLSLLEAEGAEWIQLDEPFLVTNLSEKEKEVYIEVYNALAKRFPTLKIMLATYFEGLHENTSWVAQLPVHALHVDLVRGKKQLNELLSAIPEKLQLSLGLVDGRNIWKNNFEQSLSIIEKAIGTIGSDRISIAPSCSLLHTPFDLDNETDEATLPSEVKNWMAFAKQKIEELSLLAELARENPSEKAKNAFEANKFAMKSKLTSRLIHDKKVENAVKEITIDHAKRNNPFNIRQALQHGSLKLPLFPTTTIGSFPQTKEVRLLRSQLKKGGITANAYETAIKSEIQKAISWQEQIGLDVLVHGEFERNDMVEYFGEQLNGFAFTKFGWVQSYGSRAVKPPIIYGDVDRIDPMTVAWTEYAQTLTDLPVKGMLTGPVTILQWSFVRNDQSREETTNQIALAIRKEVQDLELAGIKVIQIDEPAIREGLPLRKEAWKNYLDWAIRAFRISASAVNDETQIHTHMCYSEFNDIIESIAAMDADVITIETSRSQMELLDAFVDFKYPNEIGPGVYDIHSPRVPSEKEMEALLEKAALLIPIRNLWVNPDCGLKTRGWKETDKALVKMVNAAKALREKYQVEA
ncbi:5-methyltetrahydropteroyltriglutamate--homocysteine S-methyltransferase [Galbibacter pacificus]|uniref:5-methyltetrahydropteroyltriglutamate--homocysteine methyltransferase n=1 Tax=Galbibacter pacificus TaxID=2996052 RepID=A0ABT6FMT4_9FLAO|nr:5-methyltetrahydropteroyltriglutamate--homocysteine S-methyltransferase [Galbibacter pacificus]MDG3580928.1 5-methyltetrahydropteroyltriglutamate--homocysteine S-methyltransferase [Galbibacter pacificus]MDG3584406.1 5-methyltetrahydropteroyltriglutamate--homocysteine S-methyltransferase [Galbibacter pacificus]